MLEYESQVLLDLHNEDGLLIMAHGLGIERILFNYIKLYCDDGALVLVVNTSTDEEQWIISELQRDNVKPLPKCVTTDISPQEREVLYKGGGVIFVTSRILVVDMLTHKLPIDLVTGILVYKAHHIIESGQEAFILRLYRQQNKEGFIKAFSDNANSFTQGFCHVSRVMKNLFVKKLYLWPRFHASVIESLEKNKAEVIELEVALSANMQQIQSTVLDIVSACVKELKQCNPTLDTDEITVENILGKSFNQTIKFQLQPIWHELSFKTKQLIADLKSLSGVLCGITQCDSVSFYNLVSSLRSSDKQLGNNSGWLLLDDADVLFEHSRNRVFKESRNIEKRKEPGASIVNMDLSNIEHSPKWCTLQEVLDEINEINSSVDDPLNSDVAGKVLIVARDDRTCAQLQSVIEQGPDYLLSKLFNRFLSVKLNHSSHVSANKSNATAEIMGKRSTSTDNNDVNINDVLDIEDDDQGKCLKSDRDDNDIVSDPAALSPELYQLSQLIYVHPLTGNLDRTSLGRMLWTLKPRFIVIYDADMTFIRQVEVYKSLNPGVALRVYFLMYKSSVEEQSFLTVLRKEKEAFEYLIKEKGVMIIPHDRDGKSEITGESVQEDTNSRKGGEIRQEEIQHKVIVDMREFRSELPSLIHRRGIDIEPVTLEVGDYILTHDICVERKSLSDLIGSLNSGRLYNQALAMTRYYSKPILLIEFDQNKPFNLEQGKYLLANDISGQDLTSKLTLLTLHFPTLRFLWCSSPYATAELFEDLKMGKAQPDSTIAQKIGTNVEGDEQHESFTDRYNHIPQEILLSIPGISTKNYRILMNKVNSLVGLTALTKDALANMLSNKAAAEDIFNFLHSANMVSTSNGDGSTVQNRKRGKFQNKRYKGKFKKSV